MPARRDERPQAWHSLKQTEAVHSAFYHTNTVRQPHRQLWSVQDALWRPDPSTIPSLPECDRLAIMR